MGPQIRSTCRGTNNFTMLVSIIAVTVLLGVNTQATPAQRAPPAAQRAPVPQVKSAEDVPATFGYPKWSGKDVSKSAVISGIRGRRLSCGDGTYIHSSWAHDGYCDCRNCSDEYFTRYTCSNGEVIPASWVGDGECDCDCCCDQ